MARRTHPILFIATAILASALATLVGVAATTETAQACTPVGPPELSVRPSSDLKPGQSITVSGRHFVTIVHTPLPGAVEPNQPVPPCEVEFRPMIGMAITWSGPGLTQVLAVVDGYDFVVEVRVPDGATTGPAVIAVGGITAPVTVGRVGDPCPLPAQSAVGPDRACPDPCKYAAGDTATMIGCPCPAVDVRALPPGCPDPCAYPVGAERAALWCPDPCVYPAGEARAVPPRCPDPCPMAATQDRAVPPGCPDPCVYPAGAERAAVWCPDPCVYPAGAERAAVWCPEPCPLNPGLPRCEPCPVNLAGGAATSAQPVRPCPNPCPDSNSPDRPAGDPAPAIAVWCPPVEVVTTPPVTSNPGTSSDRTAADARVATAAAAEAAGQAPAVEAVRAVRSALQPLLQLIALLLNALGR